MIRLDDLDLTEPKATAVSPGTREGGMTIVYRTNGKRLVFSKRVLEKLGNPTKISFAFAGEYLVLSSNENSPYLLRDMTGQKVIYNSPLIREILDRFDIPYDDRFCKTFSAIEEIEGMDNAIAIKMNRSGDLHADCDH